ncbi:MAG TPA: GNAT family N-acetyltransferase [Ktedonobacteraceae bacterium]|jgi:RimJ/RimL family protein N-acetyltransferase
MQICLETARMVLRRFTADDVDRLLELDSDPEVMRFLNGGVPTPRQAIEGDILPAFLRSYEACPGCGVFAALAKAGGEFLGWFSFLPTHGACCTEVSSGYRLRRACWGQGYATEGVRALIRLGFGTLGVQRVVASTYQDNLASRRVMEKAGLVLVRRYRMTGAELQASVSTVHDASVALWDGDDLEYALHRADWDERP